MIKPSPFVTISVYSTFFRSGFFFLHIRKTFKVLKCSRAIYERMLHLSFWLYFVHLHFLLKTLIRRMSNVRGSVQQHMHTKRCGYHSMVSYYRRFRHFLSSVLSPIIMSAIKYKNKDVYRCTLCTFLTYQSCRAPHRVQSQCSITQIFSK